MNKVVVFEPLTARVKWNPEDLESYSDRNDALVNPDLSQVEIVPQEYWKKVDKTVVPMTLEERVKRDIDIRLGTITQSCAPSVVITNTPKRVWPVLLLWFSIGVIMTHVLEWFIRH